MDNRTDEEKESSQYFSHWKHTGNAVQRRLKVGPRKAVYKPISEAEAIAIAQAGETIDLPVMVTQDAKKAITVQEFNRLFASGVGDPSAYRLVKSSPWALRCIEIKAKSLASIPWDIWDGDTPVADNHEYKRLLREVNPEMNWQDLASATESDMNVFGQAFWLKLGGGKLLQRLNPATIDVVADRRGIAGFRPHGGGKPYSREAVIYFHSYDPEDDFGGMSPLESVRAPIEVEIAANKHLKEFFENKAMPDYIMSLETNNTNEIKRISDQWKREFSGAGKQHKTGWVGGGAKPNPIGYAPKDLALAEVRAEARRQICAGFGVPPALVAAWEAANYATIREQRQSLYTEVLFPSARYMAGAINAELSPLFGDVEFRWDFTKVDAMQDTEDARTKRLVWLVQSGIVKREIAAEVLGYGPEDVPDEMPGASPSDNNNNIGRAASPPPVSDDRKTESALRKWRKKALNRIRQGKSPDCDFNSNYISKTLEKIIGAALKTVKTPDDVHSVFEDVWEWPANTKEREIKVNVTSPAVSVRNFIEAQEPPKIEPHIDVKTPDVHVEAPNVNVEAPKVDIKTEIPEAPSVNVTVPVPEVNIDVPRIVREKKKVKRDPQGRVDEIDSTAEYE